MTVFRDYSVALLRIDVGGQVLELIAPTDADALLDDPRVSERFDRDEYMPYWAQLWPGALLLADAVATWGPADSAQRGPTVLELGCGLGLAGLVAASLGYAVTLSDYDEDALAFAVENARRNGLPLVATRLLDWRRTYADLRVDRVLAADSLYEARNLRPIAEFVSRHLQPGGFALLADPNRPTADPFDAVARAGGLKVQVEAVERPPGPTGRPIRGRIFRLQHRS